MQDVSLATCDRQSILGSSRRRLLRLRMKGVSASPHPQNCHLSGVFGAVAFKLSTSPGGVENRILILRNNHQSDESQRKALFNKWLRAGVLGSLLILMKVICADYCCFKKFFFR